MITFNELPNGDLKITLDDAEELDLVCQRNEDERDALYVIMDSARYIGNNWHCLFNIGLTEAPAIGYGAIYDSEEAERPTDYEKVWYFGDYQVKSYLDILRTENEVVFTRLRSDGDGGEGDHFVVVVAFDEGDAKFEAENAMLEYFNLEFEATRILPATRESVEVVERAMNLHYGKLCREGSIAMIEYPTTMPTAEGWEAVRVYAECQKMGLCKGLLFSWDFIMQMELFRGMPQPGVTLIDGGHTLDFFSADTDGYRYWIVQGKFK